MVESRVDRLVNLEDGSVTVTHLPRPERYAGHRAACSPIQRHSWQQTPNSHRHVHEEFERYNCRCYEREAISTRMTTHGAKDVPSFNVTFSQGMLVVQGRVALELPFRHVNVVWFVTEIAVTVGLVRMRSCVPITTLTCPPWPAAVA
jgi:hypothetical protein